MIIKIVKQCIRKLNVKQGIRKFMDIYFDIFVIKNCVNVLCLKLLIFIIINFENRWNGIIFEVYMIVCLVYMYLRLQ